jgi:hypothetical protein
MDSAALAISRDNEETTATLNERERILEIWSLSVPGFEALATIAADDPTCTSGQFAIKLLNAIKAAGLTLDRLPQPTMH